MVRAIYPSALPAYVKSLVSEVVEQTGCPLVVHEEEGIGYDSQLSMAGQTQPFHKLAYVSQYRDYRLHFIVNAAVKIRRFFELPPEERLIPVSEAGKRPKR